MFAFTAYIAARVVMLGGAVSIEYLRSINRCPQPVPITGVLPHLSRDRELVCPLPVDAHQLSRDWH